MSTEFYFSSAFRNIWTNKRQFMIFSLGVFMSISIISSLSIWSTTSDNTAIKDFLDDQDFELNARALLLANLPLVKDWLDNYELVESTHYIYDNLAFFNVEDKSPFYRFYPLDNQDDMSDPATFCTLYLISNTTIKRLASQFNVKGEFDLEENEVLISETQAYQIEQAMNLTVTPGTVLNLTVCRDSVDFGILVAQYQPVHFYNITVRGIYSRINTETCFQDVYSNNQIDNSIIFLRDNLSPYDIQRMDDNGLYPRLFAKCKSDLLIADGLDQIVPKLEHLSELISVNVATASVTLLTTPFDNFRQTYAKAKTTLVILAPVTILGVILAITSTNIILEKRKLEIEVYKERSGQKWQIIGFLLIEFSFVALVTLLIGIFSSILFSAFIPAIASQELTWSNYSYFLQNLKIQYWLIALAAVVIFTAVIFNGILKINQLLTKDLSERDLKFRNKLQKGFALGLLGLLTLTSIIAFIALTIIFNKNSNNFYNFTAMEKRNSSILFVILSFIIILVSIMSAIGLFELLGRMKGFYKIFMRKNSLFLINNLKNSKYKFNTLLIVLFIITSSTIYSLVVFNTIQVTNNAYQYYNNGSDLRIQTIETSFTFQETIASIDGIDKVMPVLYVTGRFSPDTITVFGINTSIYAELGRWDSSSFNNDLPDEYHNYQVNDWMNKLSTNINGSIISDQLAERYLIDYGDELTITNLPIGTGYGPDYFDVEGMFHSAPGLGLSSGKNFELNQPNSYSMLVNLEKIIYFYNVTTTNLFFASVLPGADINLIINELSALNLITEINPVISLEGYGASYISDYVPSIEIFLLIQIALTNLIGLVIIFNSIHFTLEQRKQENTIFKAFGNTNNNYFRLVFNELMVVNSTALIIGLGIGLFLAFITKIFLVPFFETRLILPMQFSMGYIYLISFAVYLIFLSFISIIPSYIKMRREKVAENIKDEIASAY
ncbi:MAG: ABC transporter permease [Asgard group archaeon]|nr:ABC transporter permease [Asgard group archaeon]